MTNNEQLGLQVGQGEGRVLLRVWRFAWVWVAPVDSRRPSRRRTWLSRSRVKVLLWVRRRRRPPVHWEQLHHERKHGTRVFPGGGAPPNAHASAYMLAEMLRQDRQNRRERD